MKIRSLIIAISAMLMMSSCIKNELPVWTKATVEFDAASWNTNAAGRTYPIMTRVPGYGRVVATADQSLTRNLPGVKKFRVNLARKFPEKQQQAILDCSLDYERLINTPVHEFVDLMVI